MSSQNPYQVYLERFNELVGNVEVGQVGSFRGKLVKKLALHSFDELQGKYDDLLNDFREMVRRSETIDERVVMSIRRTELELLIEKSPVLP
jgi:hypothetical protein